MTAATANIAMTVSSQAQNRAFNQFISDNLVAFGMVRTADTGQTLASALGAGPTAGTSGGYEIFRFNDALQSTYPVFVRVDYASGSTSALPAIWLTVGSSTNGAGTITGTKSAQIKYTVGAGGNTTYASYISGGTNGFRCAIGIGFQTALNEMGFSVERTKDVNGADTSDGVIIQGFSGVNANGFQGQYVPWTGTIRAPQVTPVIGVPIASTTLSLADGASVGMAPIFPFGQSGPVNPGSNFLLYYSPDTAAMNSVPVTIHGSDHTYMPLGTICSIAYLSWTSASIAMLYE